jgi:hypothetical protein
LNVFQPKENSIIDECAKVMQPISRYPNYMNYTNQLPQSITRVGAFIIEKPGGSVVAFSSAEYLAIDENF